MYILTYVRLFDHLNKLIFLSRRGQNKIDLLEIELNRIEVIRIEKMRRIPTNKKSFRN